MRSMPAPLMKRQLAALLMRAMGGPVAAVFPDGMTRVRFRDDDWPGFIAGLEKALEDHGGNAEQVERLASRALCGLMTGYL